MNCRQCSALTDRLVYLEKKLDELMEATGQTLEDLVETAHSKTPEDSKPGRWPQYDTRPKYACI